MELYNLSGQTNDSIGKRIQYLIPLKKICKKVEHSITSIRHWQKFGKSNNNPSAERL
jgi:hypothetical protein